jgi:hypothetical protein
MFLSAISLCGDLLHLFVVRLVVADHAAAFGDGSHHFGLRKTSGSCFPEDRPHSLRQIRSFRPCRRGQLCSLDGTLLWGGTRLLTAQFLGSFSITIATFSVALGVMYLANAIGMLRISSQGESYGLDLHEHGISAYPEYVIAASARPGGMSSEEDTGVRTPATTPVIVNLDA